MIIKTDRNATYQIPVTQSFSVGIYDSDKRVSIETDTRRYFSIMESNDPKEVLAFYNFFVAIITKESGYISVGAWRARYKIKMESQGSTLQNGGV